MKRKAWVGVLAALIPACQSTAPPAESPYLPGLHLAETADLASYQVKLARAADLKAGIVRIPADWAVLEPSGPDGFDPAYLAELEGRFQRAEELGLKAVLLFAQSPTWANAGAHPAYPPLPDYYDDYADALVRLVEAIGPERIAAVEGWNEPNSIEFWGEVEPREGTYVLVPLRYASEYAELLNAAYDALKARFPELTVLGGSLASADLDYLKALFAAGARMDALSLHPYARVDERTGPHYGRAQYPDQCNAEDPLSPPWCFEAGLDQIRAWLNQNGRAELPLWLTEFGVGSSDAWGDAGNEAEQRKHLGIALDLLEAHARRWRVRAAIWYRLQDEGEDKMGLFREDGSEKPAAALFRERAP